MARQMTKTFPVRKKVCFPSLSANRVLSAPKFSRLNWRNRHARARAAHDMSRICSVMYNVTSAGDVRIRYGATAMTGRGVVLGRSGKVSKSHGHSAGIQVEQFHDVRNFVGSGSAALLAEEVRVDLAVAPFFP